VGFSGQWQGTKSRPLTETFQQVHCEVQNLIRTQSRPSVLRKKLGAYQQVQVAHDFHPTDLESRRRLRSGEFESQRTLVISSNEFTTPYQVYSKLSLRLEPAGLPESSNFVLNLKAGDDYVAFSVVVWLHALPFRLFVEVDSMKRKSYAEQPDSCTQSVVIGEIAGFRSISGLTAA
jgi:hypothetical protein